MSGTFRSKFRWREIILAGLTIGIALVSFSFGITLSQWIAIIIALTIFTVWQYDKAYAVIFALSFDIIKPLLIRILFSVEDSLKALPNADLLGIMPSIVLVCLIFYDQGLRYSKGEAIFSKGPKRLLLLFGVIGFFSIINPNNSIMVGLGGFQRNLMPNMFVLFLASSIFAERKELDKLLKALLVIGLASIIYGLCQYTVGIFPWEKDWFLKVAFKEDVGGWMTIGLRGIEFRIYSFFYSYAGFFYTNVLIFSLVLTMGDIFSSNNWRKLRLLYFILWIATLLVTLERMASIMTVASLITVSYLRSSAHRKKIIIWAMVLGFGFAYGGLKLAAPFLEGTGVEKLVRLAELADPFNASSMEVRRELIWGPAIDIIKAHPLGVGIGFASATKAGSQTPKWSVNVQPHNEVLQKTMEMGLIGGAVFILLIISVFRSYRALLKGDDRSFSLGAGITAATVSFLICGLVNLTFSGTPGLIYWCLAGASLGAKDLLIADDKMTYQNLEYADKSNENMMQCETPA